mmetsp:Transcript_24078/g.32013  ORF Transcript_24078/g.32013 Transcript_24078/m.32013 type:complete len:1012 (+) Transcript_24078:2-3037(+)
MSPSKSPSELPTVVSSNSPTVLPSLQPSLQPSSLPSMIPSNKPTATHSEEPSQVPSVEPSKSPSQFPSSTPSRFPTSLPSLAPTRMPSQLPSLEPSKQPSFFPSTNPSDTPTVTHSTEPSHQPSALPSYVPSTNPSFSPSTSPTATAMPSSKPSDKPSLAPSNRPSSEPTFGDISVTRVKVVQRFTLADGVSRRFNDTEIEIFQDLMVSYTINFGSRQGRDDGRVDATCKINGQDILNKRRLLWNSWDDNFLSEPQSKGGNTMNFRFWEYPALFSRRLRSSFNQVTYEMTYTSIFSDTISYNEGFRDYVNDNLDKVVMDMKEAGLDIVARAETAFAHNETPPPTPAPTPQPTPMPSSSPSSSPSMHPSAHPSMLPSLQPSSAPSSDPSSQPSADPSSIPSIFPSEIPSVTHSDAPSTVPSVFPSSVPSAIPSTFPSAIPSTIPSAIPSTIPSAVPTTIPSNVPSAIPSGLPSIRPTMDRSTIEKVEQANLSNTDSTNIPAIAGSAGGAAIVAILIGFALFRKRKQNNSFAEKPTPDGMGPGQSRSTKYGSHDNRTASVTTGWSNDIQECADNTQLPKSMIAPNNLNGERREQTGMLTAVASEYESDSHRASTPDIDDDSIDYMHGMETPVHHNEHVNMMFTNDTLDSNPSLVSPGYSMSSDSDEENDSTQYLADEFDEYKDKNLEEMRTKVEGTVTNSDDMMSQALTRALMDDDDSVKDPNELTWGGSGDSTEIEASVLCEMNDWLKKREGASLDQRREFMQETLNRMVASVRYGIIQPEDASRTIHGCAAMLGLQLAEDIPETALIVTGMRKMVKRADMIGSFKEFGEIEDAAVSPNARGFGLVRFKSSKSVQRAIARFRTEEIVVEDVAVMIKVLKSDSPVESRDLPSVVDLSRHHPGDSRRDGMRPLPPPPLPRMAIEDSHQVVNLSTIGYSGDSVGRGSESVRGSDKGSDRGRRRYPDPPRPPSSDAGSAASARSRASSRSQHTSNRSGETGSSTSRTKKTRRSTNH